MIKVYEQSWMSCPATYLGYTSDVIFKKTFISDFYSEECPSCKHRLSIFWLTFKHHSITCTSCNGKII